MKAAFVFILFFGGMIVGFLFGAEFAPSFHSDRMISYNQFMDKKCGVKEKHGCLNSAITEWNNLTR